MAAAVAAAKFLLLSFHTKDFSSFSEEEEEEEEEEKPLLASSHPWVDDNEHSFFLPLLPSFLCTCVKGEEEEGCDAILTMPAPRRKRRKAISPLYASGPWAKCPFL